MLTCPPHALTYPPPRPPLPSFCPPSLPPGPCSLPCPALPPAPPPPALTLALPPAPPHPPLAPGPALSPAPPPGPCTLPSPLLPGHQLLWVSLERERTGRELQTQARIMCSKEAQVGRRRVGRVHWGCTLSLSQRAHWGVGDAGGCRVRAEGGCGLGW